MRLLRIIPSVAAGLALVSQAPAAGPGQVAVLGRSAWPPAFQSAAEFDEASRVAILAYARVLMESDSTAPAALQQTFGIKSFDEASFRRWKAGTLEMLRANYNLASRQAAAGPMPSGPAPDPAAFRSAAFALESSLTGAWATAHPALRTFLTAYFREQGRLAALFPKVSSEIAVFDTAEIQGYQYRDRHFLLTFDDGPSPKGGTTDSLLQVLRRKRLNGVFFILGDNFDRRLKAAGPGEMTGLFRGMNVQAHGMAHVSHARLSGWQEQVQALSSRIDSVFRPAAGTGYFFRPPYGQRVAEAARRLGQSRGLIMLWNIDSQDWHARITAEEAAGRCLALMLLWRRGILLFHDVHPKAQVAVPLLHDWLMDAGVVWIDADDAASLRAAR